MSKTENIKHANDNKRIYSTEEILEIIKECNEAIRKGIDFLLDEKAPIKNRLNVLPHIIKARKEKRELVDEYFGD